MTMATTRAMTTRHDHAGHDHDHGVQLPEGLSDEDILEIQKALMAGLDKLKAEFEGIQE